MSERQLLTGPSPPRARCPLCAGSGRVMLSLRPARECPTCRGSGRYVDDTRQWGPLDLAAYELGLDPR